MSAPVQLESGTSAAGLLIDVTRSLFGGTRQQGIRAGTSRFVGHGWFITWKMSMATYCIVWAAWWDRGEDIDIRVYLATWIHLLATAYFVLSTISAFLCYAYLSREKPSPVVEGKPKRPDPVKSHRSAVPCYFRFLQHISWVLSCIGSMVVMSVFWLAIYNPDVPVSTVHISATILAAIMVADQLIIASEFKIGFAWMGLYFFVVYIFYNVIYYYEHNEEDRLSFEVFDWSPAPGKACLWVFLILAFFVPGFAAFHVAVYRFRERMFASYKHRFEVVEEEAPPKKDKDKEKEDKEEEKKEEKSEKSKKEGKKSKKESEQGDAPPPPPPPLPPGFYPYPYPAPGYAPYPPPPDAAPAAEKQGAGSRMRDMLKDMMP